MSEGNEVKEVREVKIFCPLCRVPMSYTVRKNNQNPKVNHIALICQKCGNDTKQALRAKFLQA